jgi:hypothetical protein
MAALPRVTGNSPIFLGPQEQLHHVTPAALPGRIQVKI